MIIHVAPDYQIYFGDAKDQMYPNLYNTWNDFSLASREPVIALVNRLHLKNIFFLRQVHGADGYRVSSSFLQAVPPFSKDGDFLVTQEPHVGIGILTADCLPVIVYDRRWHAIGIAHAGWRGAVAGVVSEMLAEMNRAYKSNAADLTVFFGPSAKRCCYAVDSQFSTYLEAYPYSDTVMHQQGNFRYFDLPLFVEQQLLHLGVAHQAIRKEYNACTICDTRFHSYRRGIAAGMADTIGRQMTTVVLK